MTVPGEVYCEGNTMEGVLGLTFKEGVRYNKYETNVVGVTQDITVDNILDTRRGWGKMTDDEELLCIVSVSLYSKTQS